MGHANDGYQPTGNDPVPPETFPDDVVADAPADEPVEAADEDVEPEDVEAVEPEVDAADERYKQLDALTVDDLKEQAKALEVAGYSSLNKGDLIDAILAAEQTDEAPAE